MAEVDVEKLRGLAKSAGDRAQECHIKAEARKLEGECGCEPNLPFTCPYHSFLNDFFYWSGYKNAYMGIVAQLELAEIIEDELDGEPTCP